MDLEFNRMVSEREILLGRSASRAKRFGSKGTTFIGRILSLDGSLGSKVFLDFSTSHLYLICGKRGYGKSYAMGSIVEEYAQLPEKIRNRMAVVIYDTMGIFWTLKYPNVRDEELLSRWELIPTGIQSRILIPRGVEEYYRERGIPYDAVFAIRPAELEIMDWVELFGLDIASPAAALLSDAIRSLREEGKNYSIEDIKEKVRILEADKDKKAEIVNLLSFALDWGLFSPKGFRVGEIAKRGTISIIDVSSLPHSGRFSVRALVLAVIARRIYQGRVVARKAEELQQLATFGSAPVRGKTGDEEDVPITWLFIDEAHMFVPEGRKTLASDVILDEWIRQGRQPGLGLVLATQRPAALESTVISQSDVIVSMRLTAQEDIEALSRVRPSYMKEGFAELIKRMGRERGRALVVDDTSESVYIIQIKPRVSWHGGDEASAI